MIFSILAVLLFFFVTISFSTGAEPTQLQIDVADTVYGGEEFKVSVFDPFPQNGTPYLVDVLIEFNGQQYYVTSQDENGEITIKAPVVVNATNYTIIAYKEGYTPGYKNITVLPGFPNSSMQLVITPDVFTIDAYQQFSVVITDELGNRIEGVTVGIQNYVGKGSVDYTDSNGRAYLTAPNTAEIVIIAQKEGYFDGTETLLVNTAPGTLDAILQNPYTPIIIAACVLVAAIIYVGIKEGKPFSCSPSHPSSSSQLPTNQTSSINSTDHPFTPEEHQFSSSKKQESKIEEIHVTKPQDERKVVHVDIPTPQNQQTLVKQKQVTPEEFQWFEGTEDIQNKVDELTGKTITSGKEEWFEGLDIIRTKIDKKIKNKDKNKRI